MATSPLIAETIDPAAEEAELDVEGAVPPGRGRTVLTGTEVVRGAIVDVLVLLGPCFSRGRWLVGDVSELCAERVSRVLLIDDLLLIVGRASVTNGVSEGSEDGLEKEGGVGRGY